MTSQMIATSEALFRKLERSFYRREVYGAEQLDWVFDVSVTAWHLVDWTAHDRGLVLGSAKKLFKAKCPELAVCELVANGAKHRVLSDPALTRFNVTSDVVKTTALSGISRSILPGGHAVDIRATPAISVRDQAGRTWDALDLLHKVLRFWATELGVQLDAG